MDCVTKVAINASSLILFTIHALNNPTTTDAPRVRRIASTMGVPFATKSATITPENAARDPGDKSFCPAIIK